MSINVSPKVTIYSDCSRCCPRFLRVWLCCCCKVEPDQVERTDEIAKRTWQDIHEHSSHGSHRKSKHTHNLSKT